EIEWILRIISEVLAKESMSDKEFSRVENRILVTIHKRRERSSALARLAKIRDEYTRQICEYNFNATYGKHGVGFAEAHHIVSLSSLIKEVKNTPDDLITVCANCHRMLHRMDGKANDYKKLQKIAKA